jgi:glycosyltransferase involved in cell wall biosynthesis
MPIGKLKTALVLTVYNEASSIKRFLQSITKQTLKPDEIILVDGGSSDSTVNILEQAVQDKEINGLKIIKSRNRINIAEGRNIGIRSTTADLIAITDAGCVLNERWFENIIDPFLLNSNLDVVSGWYEPIIISKFQRDFAELSIQRLDKIDPRTFLPSSRSIAFTKKIWQRVGGYPEFLTLSGEDTLFDIYLKRVGARFKFEPSALVGWIPRDSFRKALWIQFSMGRGDGEANINNLVFICYFCALLLPIVLVLRLRNIRLLPLQFCLKIALVTGWILGKWRYFYKIRQKKLIWEKERRL